MSSEPDSTEFSLPLPALERIDNRCLEFEAAWKAGEVPRIEDYLGDMQGVERGELLRQLLLLDLDYRCLQADQPTVEEYRGRFSDDGEIVANAFGEFSIGTASSPPPGTRVRYFGDYELLEEIGHGGMGVVYKARQVSLNRVVALKMILSVRLTSQAAVNRFRAEAETAANLQHPNIVAVHEVGVHNGQQYFSMDYVEGRNLAEMVRENPLPAKRAAQYVRKIAEAIHYAHEQGTLHRDLKPSNVLIDTHDEPRVTDFGLAKRLESDHELTGSSEILGTPSYMAPEQAAGRREQVDSISDVYSLGATIYCLVTGRPPFQASSVVETLSRVLESEPVRPRALNPSLPRDLETICLKCLQKRRESRYQTARELSDDLGRFLSDEPIRARRVSKLTHGWRWCRRNPVTAILLSLVFTSAFLLFFANTGWAVVNVVAGVVREGYFRPKQERNNLKQVELALQNYHATYRKAPFDAGVGREAVTSESVNSDPGPHHQAIDQLYEVLIQLPGSDSTEDSLLRRKLMDVLRRYYEEVLREQERFSEDQVGVAETRARLQVLERMATP